MLAEVLVVTILMVRRRYVFHVLYVPVRGVVLAGVSVYPVVGHLLTGVQRRRHAEIQGGAGCRHTVAMHSYAAETTLQTNNPL